MQPFAGHVAAFAVGFIYYSYKMYVWHQERVLRARVAYMLWVMAGTLDRWRYPVSNN
jgi:hypothetical protein